MGEVAQQRGQPRDAGAHGGGGGVERALAQWTPGVAVALAHHRRQQADREEPRRRCDLAEPGRQRRAEQRRGDRPAVAADRELRTAQHRAHVRLEGLVGRRHVGVGDAEQPRRDARLVVEAAALGEAQRPEKALEGDQRAVDQRRMHPQQQRRIVGVVRRPGAEGAAGALQSPADARVHALDAAHRRQRLGGATEHDRQGQLERSNQPLQRLLLEAAVLGDAGGDQRMGHLQEQRPAAAEQQDRLAVHPPGDAVGREKACRRVDAAASGGGPQPGQPGPVDGRRAVHWPSNQVGFRP